MTASPRWPACRPERPDGGRPGWPDAPAPPGRRLYVRRYPLPPEPVAALDDILAAGADAPIRAVVKAAGAARGVEGPGGTFPSYSELYGTTRDSREPLA
ncbi:hypothetical protein [Streptomyces sp. NBC_00111]|uniref:hypothetical protein n=1 Tax=unclassified Streptomyces TaxID=2593676 RepID=UPI00387041A5